MTRAWTETRALGGEGKLNQFATRVYEGGQPLTPTPTPHSAVARGRVTMFMSCHGGAGSTTIATTVAALLARAGKRVCLVDLDLQFGSVLTSLNLTNQFPLSNLVDDLQQVNEEHLPPRLPRHSSGLQVLSQVGFVDGIGQIQPKRLAKVLRRLRDCFDHVIIDGVRDFNDYALPALDLCNDIVMVATQDVPALRGLVMRLELLGRLSFDRAALHVVLNRFSKTGPVPASTIEGVLGITPSFTISNDFKPVHRALSDGETLADAAPRSRVTHDIEAMVGHLYGVEEAPRRSFWSRLVGRKR